MEVVWQEYAWLAIYSLAFGFSSWMVYDSYLDWRSREAAYTNGQRQDQLIIAKAAMRRSAIRAGFAFVGLVMGIWEVGAKLTENAELRRDFIEYAFLNGLLLMGLSVLINEILDRYDRYRATVDPVTVRVIVVHIYARSARAVREILRKQEGAG